jgi:hypothetical protein
MSAAVGGAAGQTGSTARGGTADTAAVGGSADGATSAAMGGTTAAGVAGNAAQAGAAAAATSSTPVLRSGKYVIELADLAFEVDPAVGGRVTSFALGGKNVLTGADVDSSNWGSTFWPSPQARWDWPPVPELDSQMYTASVEADTLILVSQPGVRAKVRVTKRFRALPAVTALELTYSLQNTDSAPAAWAPWEISRVAPGGLTFFPVGKAAVTTALPVMTQNGTTWYRHDPASVGSGQKFSGDGSGGFIAHVAGRTLFLKQFLDVTPEQQAPAPEAEIELYAAQGYVEIEPQGPYTMLMPDQSVTWTVRWYLRALPDDITVELGNAQLLQFAQKLAQTP